ncbi:hypothetical protein BC829DRAFT_259500 [Chytridium lagenaria]|nr:hypothetical protein BC829DRAFT_259500 [Chytridium lagenaria]
MTEEDAAAFGAEDPELQGLRGFTRFFPIEEQMALAGKGVVTLHLGYVKASCKLNSSCIDLKRIPGNGEPFSFGEVHFIPVDPRLYRPEYEPPQELAAAFDSLMRSFEHFEESHRRRGESLSQTLAENPPDLSSQRESTAEKVDEFVKPAEDASTWVAQGEEEASAAVAKRKTGRMSMFQPLAGVVGGILGAVRPTTMAEPPKQFSFEDIQREMELARVKARLEAKLLEEEEDEKIAIAETRERERLARKVAEQKAQRVREVANGDYDYEDSLYDDGYDDGEEIDAEEMTRRVREAEAVLQRIESTLEMTSPSVSPPAEVDSDPTPEPTIDDATAAEEFDINRVSEPFNDAAVEEKPVAEPATEVSNDPLSDEKVIYPEITEPATYNTVEEPLVLPPIIVADNDALAQEIPAFENVAEPIAEVMEEKIFATNTVAEMEPVVIEAISESAAVVKTETLGESAEGQSPASNNVNVDKNGAGEVGVALSSMSCYSCSCTNEGSITSSLCYSLQCPKKASASLLYLIE